ncbi:reverse transcriptase-rnase h-integrase [Moniliophthora roreri MCA 2997]|uniref:Reverse transcriptase-rnase h-integrase n=1 Tax=Moniliophthora roreri (strain MCA 2997) TaxID=1381753 RepID=V2WB58_MONRO|nr:reverse transcriptase-rnase h-integrase [Moniliophthora roreri MCA 2997]
MPPWTEQQIEQDIAEAEVCRRGLLTQSISNPGGRAIPPLTRASHRELLTPLHSPSPTSQLLIEIPEEDPEIRRTLTLSSILTGSRPIEFEERFLPSTPRLPESDTLNTSAESLEELDPFQRLLQGLKNSPRSLKVQLETMAEDKKPSGSRPKREEPKVEEAVIGSAMPVQVVSAVKEVKAALPRAFMGARKDTKKFLREVLIYITLNLKAFPNDRSKKLFLLSYMTDRPGEFWKNNKTDLLLAFDPEAEKVTWSEFIDDFRTSFKPLDPALKAQLELKDLKMKERADEYTYQFTYLTKQTGYNDAVQIVAFKQGLPRSLVLKIMTRPEGAPTTIKDWMNAAILFNESYKQALEYGKTWDEEHGGKKPQRNFQKKEDVAIKQIVDIDWKEYMVKGLCFRCGRNGHRIRDCLDMPKKDEKRQEEPKKLSKEDRFARIRALVNEQTEEEKNLLLDLMEQEAKMDRNSMHIPLQYKVGTKTIETKVLLDSGAGGRFISTKLAQTLGRKWIQLPEKIKVFNVDGMANKTAWITHVVELEFQIAGKEFRENFIISGIGDEEMILGLPWLQYHNPMINWETGEIQFPPRRKIQIKRFRGILDDTEPEVLIGAKITASQEMAHQQQTVKKDIDELIPKYLLGYRDCFEKGKAERFPPARTYDHAIDLKPDFVPRNCKLYPLSPAEQVEQDKFLEENLQKGYICKSKLPMVSPFFFVAKKEKGALRPIQDYRELNKGTVKNAYPLPLISELLNKLKGATDGDQWKATFKTNRGLFKPTVMFFGLSNSPATFQAFMNDILSNFINEGWCVVYMDNILLFSKDQTEHRERMEQLMHRLKKHDLFLKPEKCKFDITEVVFLGMVIRPGYITMDPVKLVGIAEWEPPQTVKGVCTFLGFRNFYRKFIGKYVQLTRLMNDLLQKNRKFKWTRECQIAFDLLKVKFLSELILVMPDVDKPFIIEADTSKWATGAVLRQKGTDSEWHPCGYLSKSLSPMERNYEIYDRKLLAIYRALMEW